MATTSERRWDIPDILDRTDLASLLDEATGAQGHGHRRRWHCPAPDHADQHPSVTMAPDAHGHERWRCWSGDDTHRGDAIDLIMLTHRTDRATAIAFLADRAGLSLDEPPIRHPRAAKPVVPRPAPAVLDESVRRYVTACENILWSRSGRPVREWLNARGFSDEILHAHRVGADPGRALMRRPSGLPGGRSLAATFPALSPTGEVTYVQARYLEPGEGPKYENPASRLGANPRLAWTVPANSRPRLLVVCEGIPDALTAAQHDLRAVAVLGAQAPDERVAEALAHHSQRHRLGMTAVVDHDDAGRAWGTRLQRLLLERGLNIDVVTPPAGQDLNSWALADPSWRDAISPPCELSVDQSVNEIGLEWP